MRKKWSVMVMAWMLVISMFSFQHVAQAEEAVKVTLSNSITRIVAEKLAGADVSITVRDRHSGEMIYDYNGQTTIKPASNMKLLTTAAALNVLGKDYRFNTSLYTTGKLSNGVLKGDVYLKGQGDPTLSIEDLQRFAEELKAKGIQKIDGRIVGDDKWFDNDLLTPGIWVGDESYYYAAPISALTTSPNTDYDSGTIIVEAIGSAVAESPSIKVTPQIGDLQIVNEAQTVEAGETNTITIERLYQTNKIVISGNLPIDKTKKEWVTVQHPTTHTMTMFQAVLTEAGIEFTKDKVFQAATPKSAQLVAMKQSMPLEQLLIPYMKLSNNGIADILVKTMGKVKNQHGSTKGGLKVLEEYGNSINLNMADWHFKDGSGMSHENSVSSFLVSELLFKVQDEDWFTTYLNSLPVAANADRMVGGTLRTRLKDPLTAGKVFAKTGSLTGVSTLSGYLEASSGQSYIFSVLVQNKSGASTVIDEIVKVMAEEL
ncbi:D-alanyl-D-alanine carboxypeptidase/D-alanyl-D-alanine endopeptidase [Psychrobacillus lasiicapitis]|uniref:D-alanyl-D-alanine carboxypeptidase/D-alanyl-D-alanine-endopeptidase n=1 Tax=Psychrobacillus lasiicapitis TaxID=1636719 RepID=A0A544TEU0_9BACI|nr:D-alanyl-D-alanine carboxypeptidase/D-alanyl-D-alanine-endopeptidase [Psychrobacillus lasiicapitis]TQR15982.1 D-alanyl-D-alanine carboxypeptidase/D-alanyl-D-alanine-endopeptidase [Psychrobacillus lasiicapitis]GGA16670.1 D-alanyl-D-alanine carboxypeptidase DacC [Psychrobacillus lasiicapitis]